VNTEAFRAALVMKIRGADIAVGNNEYFKAEVLLADAIAMLQEAQRQTGTENSDNAA